MGLAPNACAYSLERVTWRRPQGDTKGPGRTRTPTVRSQLMHILTRDYRLYQRRSLVFQKVKVAERWDGGRIRRTVQWTPRSGVPPAPFSGTRYTPPHGRPPSSLSTPFPVAWTRCTAPAGRQPRLQRECIVSKPGRQAVHLSNLEPCPSGQRRGACWQKL